MQHFKTVTKTQTQNIASVHYTEAHKVLENAQAEIANCVFDSDCTAARQYIMLANVFASLVQCFYNNDDNEYISIAEIMQCFTHLTYYDDSYVYDDCVKNTALTEINLNDYVYLSN